MRDELKAIPRNPSIKKEDSWQDIKTAPKDGTEILVYSPADGKKVAMYKDVGSFGRKDYEWVYASYIGDDFNDHLEVWKPTHWQPLPEDPK